eukprot:768715-Hanusia_phi.AAC.14
MARNRRRIKRIAGARVRSKEGGGQRQRQRQRQRQGKEENPISIAEQGDKFTCPMAEYVYPLSCTVVVSWRGKKINQRTAGILLVDITVPVTLVKNFVRPDNNTGTMG